jgi:hypothetical protein
MVSSRQNHTPGPAPPDPSSPTNPSVLGLILNAIQDTGRTTRLISLLIAGSVGVAIVMEAAKGVHLHWPGFMMPVIRFPALTAGGAWVLALVGMGAKKAITGAWKARRELKVTVPNSGAQTSIGSPEPSPRPTRTQSRTRRLPRTRQQPGRYRLQPG